MTLGISQTAVVNPGGIKVTVAGVTDHRCPAMATCEVITIVDVTPYPQPHVATDPADFAVTLVVTQVQQSEPAPAATPASTPPPVPTAGSDMPVLSFDAAGFPLLCVSERALVELAAGTSATAPVVSTPLPLGAVSLVSEAAGDEICAMFFDDSWHVATTSDLTQSYEAYLPAEGLFWVWDTVTGAAMPWEAGQ